MKPDHKHTPEAGPEFKVLIHYYFIPYLMQNTSTPHGSKRSTPLGVKSKRQKCRLPRKALKNDPSIPSPDPDVPDRVSLTMRLCYGLSKLVK